MAIQKEVARHNGLVFNYHRVVSVNCISNRESIIEVASYLNQQERQKEAEAIRNGVPMDVYVSTQYVLAPYEPNMGITGAYQYIKGIEPFNDPQDVFEEGNDPVAVADSVASGNTDIQDIPEEQRAEVEALIPTKPADKEGFVTVSRVEPMGYSVFWDFVPDPHYDPDAEDGSYLKPFKYVQDMEVEAGFWYWLEDKALPHEAIASGTPADFYDRDFFDYVDEAEPEQPTEEVPVEQPADEPTMEPEPDTEPEPEPEPQPPVVEEVEKPATQEGDFTNPIQYEPDMAVTAGLWYTDGADVWEAIADGVPTGFDDTEFFDIVTA